MKAGQLVTRRNVMRACFFTVEAHGLSEEGTWNVFMIVGPRIRTGGGEGGRLRDRVGTAKKELQSCGVAPAGRRVPAT